MYTNRVYVQAKLEMSIGKMTKISTSKTVVQMDTQIPAYSARKS